MNQRLDIVKTFHGENVKRQLSAFIDLSIHERLANLTSKYGHGAKRIIIESALTNYLDQLERDQLEKK